jgi:FMN phosphatase YigB (HAD superfamily)
MRLAGLCLNGWFLAQSSAVNCIRYLFLDVLTVDELRSFKPNRAIYSHFLKKTDSVGTDTWLISSNPFDVLGAAQATMIGDGLPGYSR